MYCSKCGKENLDDVKFCAGCGANLTQMNADVKRVSTSHHSVADSMAKICVHVKPTLPLLLWRPWSNHYKVYITVDDVEYTIKSRDKYAEIKVVPGIHTMHIDSRSAKTRKRNQVMEVAAHMCGGNISGLLGTSLTVANYLQDFQMSDGRIQLEPGESMELRLRCSNLQQIVWWEK